MKEHNLNFIRENFKGMIFIIISSLLVASGQLFWKMSLGSDLYLLLTGFILYGLGAIFMIVAFKYGKLSVLHPMLSMSYVFAFILSKNVLKEQISNTRYLAIIFIMIGVVIIGGENE